MAGEAWGCRDCADTGRTCDWEQDGEGIKQVQVPCPTCAAHFAAVREAVEAEREACAGIAGLDEHWRSNTPSGATAIRARSSQPEPGRKGE